MSYLYVWCTCAKETNTQRLIIPTSKITTTHCYHTAVQCSARCSILLVATVFCLLPTPAFSFSIYSSSKCVCGGMDLGVYSRTWMAVCLPCMSVITYWSNPAKVAGPQVQSIKTMRKLSWERYIWRKTSDWLLPRKQIAMITNKILTESLCLHQWWDGTSAISLLLRAIDIMRQRRLQHLYSRERRKDRQKAVIEVKKMREKTEAEGRGRGRWGNKRTKLNTERRDWKVFLQKERRRAG